MGLHSNSKLWKRDEVAALIALYETERCLYDPKHKHYNDPDKQREAYLRIHEVMSRIRPHCTVGEIKHRLRCLQKQYATEVVHKNVAIEAGLCSEESYTSSMWSFGLLQFLDDLLPLTNASKTDESQEEINKESSEKISSVPKSTNCNHQEDDQIAGSSDAVIENDVFNNNNDEERILRKKRKICTPSTKNASVNVPDQSSCDREDIFGHYVATEMKNLKDNPLLYLQTKQSILQILTSANFELINPE